MALWAGVESSVKLHIERGDSLEARDEHGQTPLMLAAARNKPHICKLLIDAGASSSATDPLGRQALDLALEARAIDAALILGWSNLEVSLPQAQVDLPTSPNSSEVSVLTDEGQEFVTCKDAASDVSNEMRIQESLIAPELGVQPIVHFSLEYVDLVAEHIDHLEWIPLGKRPRRIYRRLLSPLRNPP